MKNSRKNQIKTQKEKKDKKKNKRVNKRVEVKRFKDIKDSISQFNQNLKKEKKEVKKNLDYDMIFEIILIVGILLLGFSLINLFSQNSQNRFKDNNYSSNINNSITNSFTNIVNMEIINKTIESKQYGFFPLTLSKTLKMIESVNPIQVSFDFPKYDIFALILPHAGYKFALKTMLYGVKLLNQYINYNNYNNKINRIIIFFPTHYEYVNGLCVVNASKKVYNDFEWDFDDNAIVNLSKIVQTCPETEVYDHAYEVYGPLFKVFNITLAVVPIGVGDYDQESFNRILDMYKDDSLFIISSDMIHYGPRYYFTPFVFDDIHELKTKFDNLEYKIFNTILKLNSTSFHQYAGTVCGKIIIEMFLKYLSARNLKIGVKLLNYTSSFDVLQDINIVGYASFVFFINKTEKNKNDFLDLKKGDNMNLSKSEKIALLKLARMSIEEYFKIGRKLTYDLDELTQKIPELNNPDLMKKIKEKRGVFVTLTEHGVLRGCIGYILPIKEIYKAIIDNAWNAAFQDIRFEALREEELDYINIEISILTEPQPLYYEDWQDLLKKLNKDMGVILSYKGREATFLPQVWEQIPDPEQFLMHLSLKAGLDPYVWKNNHVDIYIYYDYAFDENSVGLR